MMALLVLLERGDCLDLKEPTVSPDQKDLLGLQEKTVCPGTQDREEKSVSKGRWVPRGLPVSSGLRVHLERLAPWESGATPGPQVPLESRVCQVPLEKKALKEIQAPLEVLVKTGLQV